jgi:hypothetical protein
VTLENPENPIGPQQSAPDTHTETKDHKDKPDPPILPEMIIPNPPQPPTKQCEVTVNTKRDRIDLWTLRMEGFGLFVLCVYTVFTALMWIANNKSADAAKVAADAAVAQVGIAGKSLDASIQQFRLDQRAWISVGEMIPPSLQKDAPLTIVVDIKNTGKTFAKNFTYKGTGEIKPKEILPKLPEQYIPTLGIIPPNGLYHVTVGNLKTHPPDTDLQDIRSGEKVLWVHGTLAYEDVFGQAHWTTFCYYFIPEERTIEHGAGGFALCKVGNDAN